MGNACSSLGATPAKDLTSSSSNNSNSSSEQKTDLFAASHLVPDEILLRLLRRGLQDSPNAVATYFLHRIRIAIKNDDVRTLKKLVAGYTDELATGTQPQSAGSLNSSIAFGNDVIGQCDALNHSHMALPILESMHEKLALSPSAWTPTSSDEQRAQALLGLNALAIEKRMAVCEALLLDAPITSWERLHLLPLSASSAPDFFRSADRIAAMRLLQAHPQSSAVSLLDCLLNDATTTGKLDEVVDRIFLCLPKHSPNSSSIRRLMCEWIRMRCEVTQRAVPERVVSESQEYAYDREFLEWILATPKAVQFTLLAHYLNLPGGPAKEAAQLVFSRGTLALAGRADSPTDSSAALNRATETSSSKLRHWVLSTFPGSNLQADGGMNAPQPWLLTEDRQLRAPLTAPGLLFKYPLEGNYGLRLQVSHAGLKNSLGGIIRGVELYADVEPGRDRERGSSLSISTLSARLTSTPNSGFKIEGQPVPDPVVVACDVQDDSVSFRIGDQQLGKIPVTSQSFPFAGLIPSRPTAQQKLLEITGAPQIARSVNLLDASLSGWSANRYNRQLAGAVSLRNEQPGIAARPFASTTRPAWKFDVGELRSDGSIAQTNVVSVEQQLHKSHNSLLYARPLLEGERFEYEIFCVGSNPLTAPVVGLTAMMIEDERVRLHWLPTWQDTLFLGIRHDNRADDPQGEQLLPAKFLPGQWNKIALRIADKRIVLSLNDQDVYRRPVPANTSNEFGWLSVPDKTTDRIRNATLSGDWPMRLPDDLFEAEDLLRPTR